MVIVTKLTSAANDSNNISFFFILRLVEVIKLGQYKISKELGYRWRL